MLAYDLYISNKDKDTITKRETPLKKIFFKNNIITVENVHSPAMSNQPSIKFLQDWLSMPLNTANYDKMKLADISVQSSQKPPYVRIYCKLEKKKIDKNYTYQITMSIGKEPEICSAVYDIEKENVSFETLSNVKVRINKKDYLTSDGKNLFDQYVTSKVLTQDATFCHKTFKQIIIKFVENIKEQQKPNMNKLDKKLISFWLYILPTKEKIIKKKTSEDSHATFVDAFGNNATQFPSKTTLTAKFLSADDKAFTINCTKKDELYKNIGIGNVSLEKVELPTDNIMWVSGYEWAFVDMETPSNKFKSVRSGILNQLKTNYEMLHMDSSRSKHSLIKVMCMIRNQNKIEILLDENLTMKKQEQILGLIPNDIPFNAIEIMIPKQVSAKRKPIWADYLYVIKSFLARTKINRSYFLSFFTRQIHRQKLEMLDKHNDGIDFFKRADFLLKFLSCHDSKIDHKLQSTAEITPDEEYAQKIGMIARYYIDYKRKYKEENNSLTGILKYSKYDRATLQNVLTKVGAGLALSKGTGNNQKPHSEAISNLEEQIQNIMPQNEITQQSNDYAYFFYKGYFTGDKK